jgi:hypothetical protein
MYVLKRQLKTVICLDMLGLELFVLDTDPICLLGSVPYSANYTFLGMQWSY